MTPEVFAALFDHTALKPETKPEDIRTLCAAAREHRFKAVCVNPCYVPLAAQELAGTTVLPITVVGFPLGANRTDVKIDETLRAIGDGAREVDMVINVGFYLGGEKSSVRHDIAQVVRAAGKVPVKVILETAFLTKEQIQELTHWCAEAGAAFVKTSTGFAPRGATVDDLRAMRGALGQATKVGIKASGGIKTLDDALAMVEAGATRIGSSGSVKILSDFRQRFGPNGNS
jgi:deoxyribose-phosphate aldolase